MVCGSRSDYTKASQLREAPMNALLGQLLSRLPRPLDRFALRFDKSPIGSPEALVDFARARSAHVAQTSLYGYLKTRMGTQFPRFFEDDTFSASIRIGAEKLFVSCLADLTVFAVARVVRDGRLAPDEAAALAGHCFREGLERARGDGGAVAVAAGDLAAFDRRASRAPWPQAAEGASAFAGSEEDVVRFAPVVDAFKKHDREIVANSIRFRWRDVREQLTRRLDGRRLCEAWRSRATPSPAERPGTGPAAPGPATSEARSP